VLARSVAGYVAIERGEYGRGTAAFDAARLLSGDIEVVNALAGSALVDARAGRRQEARAILKEADSLGRAYSPTPLHTAVYVAEAYTGLGDVDRAMGWLARYQPRGDLHFQLHLRCDPAFTPIEQNPGFRALLLPETSRPRKGC
jgi:hypothetical protein